MSDGSVALTLSASLLPLLAPLTFTHFSYGEKFLWHRWAVSSSYRPAGTVTPSSARWNNRTMPMLKLFCNSHQNIMSAYFKGPKMFISITNYPSYSFGNFYTRLLLHFVPAPSLPPPHHHMTPTCFSVCVSSFSHSVMKSTEEGDDVFEIPARYSGVCVPSPNPEHQLSSQLLRQRGANRGAHADGVSRRLMRFPLPAGRRFKLTEVKDMNLPQELHGSAALRRMQGCSHSQILSYRTVYLTLNSCYRVSPSCHRPSTVTHWRSIWFELICSMCKRC